MGIGMSNENEWSLDRPPNGKLVEVQNEDGTIIRARAIWGDRNRGVLPHWESEDGVISYDPSWFMEWREISK